MDITEARRLVRESTDDEPPVLPRSVLRELTIEAVPEESAFQVGSTKDFLQPDWEGTLWREGDRFVADAEYLNTRKYWYSPLGLEQFMDLVRRSVETRQRSRGDVALQDYEDDGAYIRLIFRIVTGEKKRRSSRRCGGSCAPS
jgi:hypothetical protein